MNYVNHGSEWEHASRVMIVGLRLFASPINNIGTS